MKALTLADLRVVRFQRGCVVCHRPFRRGMRAAICGRCGAEAHTRCYGRRGGLVLCAGCRS